MRQIIRVFLNTDMRLSYDGLKRLCESEKFYLDKLDKTDHVLFLNSKKNRVKIYSSNKVLSYLWKEKGEIDMDVIGEIARTFSATGTVDINEKYKKILEKKVKK